MVSCSAARRNARRARSALEKTYGLGVTEFTSLDAGGPLTRTALLQGKIAVGLVFSSDAALGS